MLDITMATHVEKYRHRVAIVCLL